MFRASLAYGPNDHTQPLTLRFENFASPEAAWGHLRHILDEAIAESSSVIGPREDLVRLRAKMAKRFKRGHTEVGNIEARVY